jgi:hypothetical protein
MPVLVLFVIGENLSGMSFMVAKGQNQTGNLK